MVLCQYTTTGKQSRRGFCFTLLHIISHTEEHKQHERVQSSSFPSLPASAVSKENGFEDDFSQMGSLEVQASSADKMASGSAFFKALNI